MTKSADLDQYFTKGIIAKQLYERTDILLCDLEVKFDCWLEPAAGDGSFFHLLPLDQRLGIDIDKRIDEIIEDDFLTISIDTFVGLTYVAIGNPPFGKNSHLAVKFFNRCAEMCSAIAFIVPKTFKKTSITNRLDMRFFKVDELELPDNAFEIDGKDKSVPCVFQIWVKFPDNDRRQEIKIHRNHPDLEFLPTDRLDEATILFQRVGAAAGSFKEPSSGTGYSWKSNYHIRCSEETARTLRTITTWPTKYDTAGNPSISKSDLIKAYEAVKGK